MKLFLLAIFYFSISILYKVAFGIPLSKHFLKQIYPCRIGFAMYTIFSYDT